MEKIQKIKGHDQGDEFRVNLLTDAVVHPNAVMVETRSASVALSAVFY